MENNQNSNASNNNQQKSSHGCAIAFCCFIAMALVVFLCIYFFIIKPATSEKIVQPAFQALDNTMTMKINTTIQSTRQHPKLQANNA